VVVVGFSVDRAANARKCKARNKIDKAKILECGEKLKRESEDVLSSVFYESNACKKSMF